MINKTNIKIMLIAISIFFFSNVFACANYWKVRRADSPVNCSLDIEVNIGGFLNFKVGADSKLRESILFDLTDSPSSNNSTFNQANLKKIPNLPNVILGVSDIGRASFINIEILSNKGNVVITAAATTLTNASGDTIPLSKITGQSLLGIILHPTINSGKSIKTSCTSFVSVSNCVTQRQDFWQYLYTNDTTPIAGTYKSIITYKASTP